MQQASRDVVAPWDKYLKRISPRVIDVALAVGVAVAVTIAISVASEPGTRPPDLFAYALGVTIGALALARRRWPVGVLVASVITLQIYYFANYPGISAAVPLAVALYTVSATGHLRWALGVAGWYWVIQLFFVLFVVLRIMGPLMPDDFQLPADYRREVLRGLVLDGSLLLSVVLLGETVRNHRALMSETAERLRRVAEDRQREEQELSAARVIQLQLLPKELPSFPGWHVSTHYQPARAVGGDFYDFFELPDNQIALVVGDVTDKGIPAALVMASTQSILRGDAPELVSPSLVLERANNRLFPDIPTSMFVTCLYAVLDPGSGQLCYANAGHNLPYVATANGVGELHATGMPLGALPDMTYEENGTCLAPGDCMLLYSDGLVEAHGPSGEMFGLPRLQKIVETSKGTEHLIEECLSALRAFTGPAWEQEDDITLVMLSRATEMSTEPELTSSAARRPESA